MVIDRPLMRPMGELVAALFRRPLHPRELLIVWPTLLIAGAVYCTFYCMVAYFPMHSGGMTFAKSLYWSALAMPPWLVALEGAKRIERSGGPVAQRLARHLALLGAAVLAGAAFYWLVEGRTHDHPMLTRSVAMQFQPAILLLAFLGGQWLAPTASGRDSEPSAPPPGDVPPIALIERATSAGNYVEFHVAGRSRLARMTMAQAEAMLVPHGFVRLHRSLIVRQADLVRVERVNGRAQARLADGTLAPIGESYQRAVERLIPSSR